MLTRQHRLFAPRVSWDVLRRWGVRSRLYGLVSAKSHSFGEQTGRSVSESGSQPIQRGYRAGSWTPSPPPRHLHQINTSHSSSHLSPHPSHQHLEGPGPYETPSWIETRKTWQVNVANRTTARWTVREEFVLICCFTLRKHIFQANTTLCSRLRTYWGYALHSKSMEYFPLHNQIRSVTHEVGLYSSSTCATKPLKPEANQSQRDWNLDMPGLSRFSDGQWITHARWPYEMGGLTGEKWSRPFETLTRVIARRLHITLI